MGPIDCMIKIVKDTMKVIAIFSNVEIGKQIIRKINAVK